MPVIFDLYLGKFESEALDLKVVVTFQRGAEFVAGKDQDEVQGLCAGLVGDEVASIIEGVRGRRA